MSLTRCMNRECPSRDKCYRATAKRTDDQAFSFYEPDADGKCGCFLSYESEQTDESEQA